MNKQGWPSEVVAEFEIAYIIMQGAPSILMNVKQVAVLLSMYNVQFKENWEWMSWEIILLLFAVVQPALVNDFDSFYQLSTARQL